MTLEEARSHPACGKTVYINERLHAHFWPDQGLERYTDNGGEYDEQGMFRGPFLLLGDAKALLDVMVCDRYHLELLTPLVGYSICMERRKGQGPGWYTVSLVAENDPLLTVSSL